MHGAEVRPRRRRGAQSGKRARQQDVGVAGARRAGEGVVCQRRCGAPHEGEHAMEVCFYAGEVVGFAVRHEGVEAGRGDVLGLVMCG